MTNPLPMTASIRRLAVIDHCVSTTAPWLAAAMLLAVTHVGEAQSGQPTRSLEGIQAFIVEVHTTDDLNRSQLQTTAELELRRSGVKIITADQLPSTPGAAELLIVAASARSADFPVVGGMTTVEVVQAANLRRTPETVGAFVTWRSGGPWLAGTNRLQNVVENSVRDEVSIFLNDYLSANPKAR